MEDYTTSLMAQLDRAAEAVIDDIAKEGLVALKSVLDQAGFGKYEYLKSYEVYVHVLDGEVTFEIQVEFDALDDDSKKILTDKAPEDSRTEGVRRAARMYAISGVGGTTERIVGRRDARRPAHDARKRLHDARKPAREVEDTRKDAAGRLSEHEFALRAPRGLSITKQGKLSIALERTMEETSHGVRFPQGDFQGLMGQFMKKLQKVISGAFIPQLEKILSREIE